FLVEAAGANVRDAEGNVFVDLTAGFGVAAAGHGDPSVVSAIVGQAEHLVHAMGDVHPAVRKVELLELLAELAPGDLSVGILSANGSDAVESALKTATLVTGKPGLVAFEGAYHGLGYGALSATWDRRFRDPFQRQLYAGVGFAPYPATPEQPLAAGAPTTGVEESLARVRSLVESAAAGSDAVGAVIVEPVQGRGGIIVPAPGFLPGLRRLCDELGLLLIVDEIYTGFGRTGTWFACDHEGVVPDLLVVGKSLAGGLPLSAVLGSPELMESWPTSEGEAIHTSTFLGNPVACAAAVAHLGAIRERGLVERAAALGEWVEARVNAMAERRGDVAGCRGRGLMRAMVLAGPGNAARAARASELALRRGVLVLPEGGALALTPPLSITEQQLSAALDVLESVLDEVA
ncbi:MAG TPA: aspartate aminotransferase family protein, partial [Longimicrobiales bacterium]|nr:aspartate aminotransferase family protein [Longimicrobiales bacterium]